MAFGQKLTSPIKNAIPKATNFTGAAISGIGAYKVARFLDGMIGNRLQAIGVPLPLVGRISALDLVMALSFKGAFRKNSMVIAALAGDRVFNVGTSLAGLIPGSSPSTTSPATIGGSPGGGF